jgi:FkbM family methyltransferase
MYDIYWAVADSRVIARRSRELEFYRSTLAHFREGDLIFDIGANEGFKTDIFLRLGARVVAVEPDEINEATLRKRFLDHRLFPKRVKIVRKAVSDSSGSRTMWIDSPGSAKNTLDSKWVEILRGDEKRFGHALSFGAAKVVDATTLENIVDAYGVPFYVKIDVEGHEPSVLRGLKQPVAYLSFEVNLPEFAPEGLECINLLNDMSCGSEFNYVTDCQEGLVLRNWVSRDEFAELFEQIRNPSIEVFCRFEDVILGRDHRVCAERGRGTQGNGH